MFYSQTAQKRPQLMELFAKELREDYFQTAHDISKASPEKQGSFYRLTSLIADYADSNGAKKEILKNEAKTLFLKEASLNEHYQTINGVKQDLATFALEFKATDLAVCFINAEDESDAKAKEIYLDTEARINGASYDNDDEEISYAKSERQKAALLMLYSAKENAFGTGNDTATKLMKECHIDPHQIFSLNINGNRLKTTPFLYFLRTHDDSKTPISVPTKLTNNFYFEADTAFEDFDGKNMATAFLNANLYSLSAQVFEKSINEKNNQSTVTVKPNEKETDLFSFINNGVATQTKPETAPKKISGQYYTPDLFDFTKTRE